ncbi:MAG: M28 family peptidase [Myxococcales bacterium]|nr:M28 family peptidase [Myxococcales bacterium]
MAGWLTWMAVSGCTSTSSALTASEIETAVSKADRQDAKVLMAQIGSLVEAYERETPTFPYEDRGSDLPHRRVESTAWVFAEFTKLGLSPWIEETVVGELPVTNVVAELPGASDELVLVTSHHDVWYAPADDNTSGVVAMLAVAQALSGESLDRTVRFVSFDQEETNFGGSVHHYRNLEPSRVHAVINMDSIAYADSTPGSQSAPVGFYVPDVADFLAVIGNKPADDMLRWAVQLGPALPEPLRVVTVHGVGDNAWPLLGDLHRSDQSQAWLADIPASFLTDTTEFRNERYHTENDTVDSLDPAFFDKTTRLVTALTWVTQAKR